MKATDTITIGFLQSLGWKYDVIYGCSFWRFITPDGYPLTLREDMSNFPGRNWVLHVDSKDCCTIGAVDIDNCEQFDKMMDLLDIEFRLSPLCEAKSN